MERDAVEVGDSLVYRCGRGTGSRLAVSDGEASSAVPREALGKNRLDQHILIVE